MHMSSVVMVVLLAAPAQPLKWKVTGTDVTFEMTTKDLRALRGGKQVFGLKSREAAFLSTYEPAPDTETSESWEANKDSFEANEAYSVLSVVGSWVSYEKSVGGYTGGAHPYAARYYVTEDVTKDKSEFSLLDVFPEKEVLKALQADSFVRNHINDEAAFKSAKTVEALLESLEPGGDCVGFDGESVKRSVAFHHLEGNRVAVRIAFGYDNESCRGNMFVVGLLLPIPDSLRSALERANKRQEGFLMKDAKAVKAPTVIFEWEPSKKK